MTPFWLYLSMALIVLILAVLAAWGFVIDRNAGLHGDAERDNGLTYNQWRNRELGE